MNVWYIIKTILVGLVVGILARFFYRGPVHMTLVGSALLGIIGSYLAGFVGNLIHGEPVGDLRPAGWIASIIGAMALIFVGKVLFHLPF